MVIFHNHRPDAPCNATSCPVARHFSIEKHRTESVDERFPRAFRVGDEVEFRTYDRRVPNIDGVARGSIVAMTDDGQWATIQVGSATTSVQAWSLRRARGSVWEESEGAWFYEWKGAAVGPWAWRTQAEGERDRASREEFFAMTGEYPPEVS